MSAFRGLVATLLCCVSALTVQAQQAPLLEEIRTVSSAATPAESPSFAVVTAGQHTITLTDLGALLPQAAPVSSIHLAVMRGATVAATLNAAGSTQANLPAGTYVIRVAGQPGANAGSGLFSAAVVAAGAAQPLFSFDGAITALPSSQAGHVRLFQGSATLAAGNYQAELVDLAFPRSLTNASAVVTAGANVAALLNLPATIADNGSFTLTSAGSVSIFALGDSPVATNAGLFMFRIRNSAGNAVVFARLLPVGDVASLGFTSNLAAGQYALVGADLAFPAPLLQSGVLLANTSNTGTADVARLSAPGSLTFTVTTAGVHEAFGLAVPGSSTTGGALAVEVRQTASRIFSAVRTVGGDVTSGTPVFAFPVDVITADSYTATITDMQFPAALASVNVALAQGAAVTARRDQAGAVSGNLAAGRSFLLVAARPGAGGSGIQQTTGLLGIQLAASTGGTLLQLTQGVGGVFSSRSFAVPATGDYRFTLDDVGFPVPFTELAAAVTRGTERLGLIYGKGSFDVLQAQPGNYVINFITRPDATTKSGTYYLSAALKPATPALTLTSNPVSPSAGATVTLTWSAQDASSCLASGGWSGTRPLSGSEVTAAISTAVTYTLTCTGAGGSTAKSLTVTPGALNANSGGGGALGALALAGLASLLLTHRSAWRPALRVRQ